jgi:hypothetical protein
MAAASWQPGAQGFQGSLLAPVTSVQADDTSHHGICPWGAVHNQSILSFGCAGALSEVASDST